MRGDYDPSSEESPGKDYVMKKPCYFSSDLCSDVGALMFGALWSRFPAKARPKCGTHSSLSGSVTDPSGAS